MKTRRSFLHHSAAAGMLAGLGDLGFLSALSPVHAEDVKSDPSMVRFTPEMEPLVRLIEDTPRAQLIEEVGHRVQQGLSYRELVAAIFLAGIRNVRPRPSAGFKFHSVLVVNAAHQASVASPPEHRWLPIFYALDYFKETQAQQIHEGAWHMGAVDEPSLPPASRARQAFIDAMDHYDEAAADAAITSLVRSGGAQDIFELFFHYGARGYRDWHHSIYVANSLRLLSAIGWHHAETVLRSLTYALLSGGRPAAPEDARNDQTWQGTVEKAGQMRPDWLDGRTDAAATRELLGTFRQASADDAAAQVVALSKSGIGPQSFWDAMLVRSVETLLCQRGFVALHCVTTTNALHYAWRQSGDDRARRQLLLYAASFLPLFRESMHRDTKRAGKVTDDIDLEKIEPAPITTKDGDAIDEIFHDIGGNRLLAARKVLTYAGQNPIPVDSAFFASARAMVFLKGNEPHDYKFSESIFEDYRTISPEWRNRYLAGSVFWLRGAGTDNPLVARTRAALTT